ncbi:ATP-binding protein [Rhodopirellula sallentina]|uniref:histidine kinase n=1 Tax=Rhodopirellula sallentina SM41 TaxID=1263870 RepID=M5U631_9BACT|nr:ATP-binding protein [Rhodopirellula sallentina]EMI56704.1 multi-sensor signal transduction histidine kinase [Rhodopirellula sallentina SM41]
MYDALNVLLVEADRDCSSSLTQILRDDGHSVRIAETFDEIRTAGIQPSIALVILERELPDGLAEDVLPELKQLLPNADFVIVAAYADLDHAIVALKLGVVDYICKPFHADVVRASVARICKRRRVEDRLCEEHQFATEVLKTAEAVILLLDMDGTIEHVNSYFSRIAGWQLEELRGRNWFTTCVPTDDRRQVRDIFVEIARRNESTGAVNSVLTKTGATRQIRWSNTTLYGDDGQAKSILAIGVDVTDLIAAQQSSVQSQRLAAIGQTVARIAHESRNALQRIQASVEILQLDIPVGSDMRDEVDSIYRASNELKETLEEVREYAAPIHLNAEPVFLPTVWRRVWEYLAITRSNRVASLKEDICDCDIVVEVDEIRMERVFRNLFENSLAACSDPAQICVTCRCDEPGWIHVIVQDNGPGLTQQQREKLFDPFFTTKARGTGLGMSIVQRILEAHGGGIEISDTDQSGACFLMRVARPSRGQSCCYSIDQKNEQVSV